MPAGKNKCGFKIKKLILGEMAANCYLIFDEKSRETIIVDPGDEADYIETVIADLGLNPTCVIATHGHSDHVSAVYELKLAYKIPFLANEKDKFLLNKIFPFSPEIDKNLVQEEKIKIGPQEFTVVETPGHTPGSICLYSRKNKIAFVGDLIFKDGSVGRYDFGYSDKEGLKISVAKILALPRETTVYPGHGEEFTVADFGT